MKKLAQLTLFSLMLVLAAFGTVQAQTSCPTFTAPIVTHGDPFAHYVIPQQRLTFTVTTPANSGVQTVTAPGNTVGGINGVTSGGLSVSTPNSMTQAVSCQDSFWDINFVIRKSGATVGDKVTLFLQNADGTNRVNLVLFTVQSGGAQVTQLNPTIFLFLNDRNATSGQVNQGDVIPFVNNQTGLLTIALNQALMSCRQLGFEIMRAGGTGTTSVIMADIIMFRDNSSTMTGPDINGNMGTFPTGLPCGIACPQCPPGPPTGCTYTQGFYKNHPNAWPVNSLTLGNRTYTKAQLLNIYNTPVNGNGLISLAHQLITAKLNAARGTSVPGEVASAISQADTLIGNLVVGVDSVSTSSTSNLVEILTRYNEGRISGGPRHCG